MPSVVWCDRAPYHVRQSQSEIGLMLREAWDDPDNVFIWLDVNSQFTTRADGQGDRVMLKVNRISAIEAELENAA